MRSLAKLLATVLVISYIVFLLYAVINLFASTANSTPFETSARLVIAVLCCLIVMAELDAFLSRWKR